MAFGKRQPRGYYGVERRRHAREKVDLSAHVVLSSGQLVRCRLTDYSGGGARISIPSAFALPDAFELRGIGRLTHVRLVHRGVGAAGVEFV
jgi:PilZ domain